MARKVIITKTCTKSGKVFSGTFEELTAHFYRDKSQKDRLSPWSKDAERAYNKAYRASLSAAGAPKKRVIDTDDALAKFEAGMSKQRVTRRKGTRNKAEVATSRAAKANAKATTTRRKARAAKKA